ncbi:MAG TPA: hypothetical protein VFQ53_19615 [Kofleriaceae bacterium]|nr:hypothetical protein [Kofleriaceae bacterium]
MRWLLAVAVVGCKAIPPPPVLPQHFDTSRPERETVTATVVVGFAGQVLGGDGLGVALRVERQQTDRTTLGIELAGGRAGHLTGDDEYHRRHLLVAVRGYGRFVPDRTEEALALTYGAGLSLQTTGLVTAGFHAGLAFSWVNDRVEPLGGIGLALAVPVRRGAPYGEYDILENGTATGVPQSRLPRTELFPYGSVGALVPVGATGNRLSVDAGFAIAVREDIGLMSLSFGDAQRFDAR